MYGMSMCAEQSKSKASLWHFNLMCHLTVLVLYSTIYLSFFFTCCVEEEKLAYIRDLKYSQNVQLPFNVVLKETSSLGMYLVSEGP